MTSSFMSLHACLIKTVARSARGAAPLDSLIRHSLGCVGAFSGLSPPSQAVRPWPASPYPAGSHRSIGPVRSIGRRDGALYRSMMDVNLVTRVTGSTPLLAAIRRSRSENDEK